MRGEEFERLYAAHAGRLLGFLVYRTGDRALAEDVLADAFERVLAARAGYDRRRGSETTWLYAIALNCLRNHERRARAETRALVRARPGPRPDAAPELVAVEDRDLVARSLEVLSTEEREAVALRYGADLTVPEIARLTGEPLTTVEGRVYRALRKLRDALA